MAAQSMQSKKKKLENQAHTYTNPLEQGIFAAIDKEQKGYILKEELITALEHAGIGRLHHLVRPLLKKLKIFDEKKRITAEQFSQLTKDNHSFLHNALSSRLIIPDFQHFRAELTTIFHTISQHKEGSVATYIPQLARVNKDLLSLSVCTIDGQMLSLGDAKATFSAQSTCKVLNYCLVQKELGEEKVHRYIGKEPSGHRFNVLRLNKDNKPHNPFINAGAIMACSLIKPGLNPADRFDYLLDVWEEACGGLRPGFNNAVYLSEKNSADRNFAIAYFMQEKKAFPKNTDIQDILDFYFQCCSIELTTTHLSVLGATLANAGVCPLTQKQIFDANTVKNCLSLMYSCGLYDFSGQFAFKVGLPAKTGVSGAIILVIPNVMGASLYSPKVDSYGNSVRGVAFCTELVKKFNFHNFDSLVHARNKEDPRYRKNEKKLVGVLSLIWAASQGDLMEMQRLHAAGVDYNAADYDGRTALHLAAAEGQEHVVQYLLEQKVPLNPVDRFGQTPLVDALKAKHLNIVMLLKNEGAHTNKPGGVDG